MFHDDRDERDYPRERRRFHSDDRGPNSGDRPRPMLTRERLERQVYCHNVPFRSSWQDLKDFMRSAGEVEHVKILEGPTGRSRGCAVVTYMDKEGARKAVDTLHGVDFQGRAILVREERTASFLRASNGGEESRYRSNYRGGRYEDDRHYDERPSPRDRNRYQQSYRRENDHYYRDRSPPRERDRYYQRSRSPPRSSRHHRASPPAAEERDYRSQRDSRRSYHDNRYEKADDRQD